MAEKAEKKGNAIWETIKTIFWALIIAGVFRTLFFQPFWIPSGSMKDTLLIGDFLFVNKMAYGYSYASCPSIIIQRGTSPPTTVPECTPVRPFVPTPSRGNDVADE